MSIHREMSYPMVYQIVKFTLISLLSLMIFCTTLAIILVCLASVDYNNNVNDRSLGIIIVLTLITIVFLLGLIGVTKSHFPTVLLFSCIDLFLLVITYNGSYSTRGANLGAFIVFFITTLLSFLYLSFIWRKYLSKTSATTEERLIHPQHRHQQQPYIDDYEYDNCILPPTIQSSSVAYDQNYNDFNPYQTQQSGYWLTVESNDCKQLIGDRYSV